MAELTVKTRERSAAKQDPGALSVEDSSGSPARSGLPVVEAPRHPGALPRRTVSHASGGRDLWSDPLTEEPADPEGAAWRCLGEVLDPEIPISVVDLGLIYGLEMEDGRVTVELTFTATACPCMEVIREDIRDRLEREPWIRAVDIEEVWDPPWTRDMISEKGRARLRTMGVSA